MELGEKLQELRKSRGLTQEALAEELHVSRTAISKWESGRGWPSIDSLKELSAFFGVTIDELLSAERLITIAEQEERKNTRRLCDVFIGVTDLLFLAMILLPLYPHAVENAVYSVDLLQYSDTAVLNRAVYWGLFLCLILAGSLRLMFLRRKEGEIPGWLAGSSLVLGCAAVMFPAMAGETYAVVLAFLLLLIKGGLLLRKIKNGG